MYAIIKPVKDTGDTYRSTPPLLVFLMYRTVTTYTLSCVVFQSIFCPDIVPYIHYIEEGNDFVAGNCWQMTPGTRRRAVNGEVCHILCLV